MMRLAVHQLRAHRRRLVSTLMAVTLGVSFLVGTLVLSDTTHAAFDSLFAGVYARTDAVVDPKPVGNLVEDGAGAGSLMDAAVVPRVASVDGVDAALPKIQGYGAIVGADGKPVGGMGPPTFAGNWIDDVRLNPYRVTDGRTPQADDEVVVNVGAADSGKLHLGDTATVLTPEPVTVKIVGLSKFGEFDSAGGSTFVGFTMAGAERFITHQPGRISEVAIAGRPGVSQEQLASRISSVLGPDERVRTGAELVADAKQGINDDFLGFLDKFLLAFALIALIVATFSIANTFSIIVAQRTRESALLRAIGASRGQVLRSTLLETFVIGVVASALGIAGGFVVALGLKGLFALIGAALPTTGMVLSGGTVIAGMVVGTTLTVVAGVLPARRASRTAPLAALREVSIDRTATSGLRMVVGSVAAAAGAGLVLSAALASGDGMMGRALIGAVVLLVGAVVIGPVLAVPVARLLGWPLTHGRSARRVSGQLARENAVRNPRRTSGTAAALMIGVAVVTLFTVVASSLKVSVNDSVGRSFAGDLVVSGGMSGPGFSPQLAEDIAAVPEVRTAVGLAAGAAEVDGARKGVNGVDPAALADVLDLKVSAGSLADLAPGQLAVATKYADTKHWTVGTSVPVRFADGQQQTFTVGALYGESDVMGDLIINRTDWAPHATQDLDVVALVGLQPSADKAAAQQSIQQLASRFPGTQVETRDQYVEEVGASINQMLVMIYAMLVLAIVIALMGIGNTLALSIHERTRELGLLRAVGQTTGQLRSMIRRESIIVSLYGTGMGIGLGVFLGWALVRSAASEGIGSFSAAPAQLAVVVVVGALAGVLAARRPARRAARLDVLGAIATD